MSEPKRDVCTSLLVVVALAGLWGLNILSRLDQDVATTLILVCGEWGERFIRWHLGDLVFAPCCGGILTLFFLSLNLKQEYTVTVEEWRFGKAIFTIAGLCLNFHLSLIALFDELHTSPADPDVIMFLIPVVSAFFFLVLYKRKRSRLLSAFS